MTPVFLELVCTYMFFDLKKEENRSPLKIRSRENAKLTARVDGAFMEKI